MIEGLICPFVGIQLLLAPGASKWNEEDYRNMRIAETRCRVKFEHSPCLKKFIKQRDLTYEAICGDKQ